MTDFQATQQMVAWCFDSIVSQFKEDPRSCRGVDLPPTPSITPDPSWSQTRVPIFVTLKTLDDHLKGCKGTFENRPLDPSLWNMARTSAFRDRRFSPVKAKELSSLACSVSLLVRFEDCQNIYDWDVGTNGIRIRVAGVYGATYLPHVASSRGWSKDETFQHLCRKAGCHKKFGEQTRSWFERNMTVTRYQTSVARMEWGEYVRAAQEAAQ